MRNIIILTILIIASSCAKEKELIQEYINYDSEIFSGRDTLLYGNWVHVPLNVIIAKLNESDIPYETHLRLNITPIGNFERFYNDTLTSKGKLDTLHFDDHSKAIRFCKNGIKTQRYTAPGFYYFNFTGTDILSFYGVGVADGGEDYYIRIK